MIKINDLQKLLMLLMFCLVVLAKQQRWIVSPYPLTPR